MRKKRHPSEKKLKLRKVRRMPLRMKMILRFRMFDLWKNMLKFSEVWLIRIILLVQIRVTTTYKIQMKFAHLRLTRIWVNLSFQSKLSLLQIKFKKQINIKLLLIIQLMISLTRSNLLRDKWKRMKIWIDSMFSRRRCRLRVALLKILHPITTTCNR